MARQHARPGLILPAAGGLWFPAIRTDRRWRVIDDRILEMRRPDLFDRLGISDRADHEFLMLLGSGHMLHSGRGTLNTNVSSQATSTQTTTSTAIQTLTFKLWGAAGGGSNIDSRGIGGPGGYATGTVSLIVGDVLTWAAGQGGKIASSGGSQTLAGGTSGSGNGNGGASTVTSSSSARPSGTGGGRTELFLNGTLIAVAGAGGGAGETGVAGAGGGTNGNDAASSYSGSNDGGQGRGATGSTGGIAGTAHGMLGAAGSNAPNGTGGSQSGTNNNPGSGSPGSGGGGYAGGSGGNAEAGDGKPGGGGGSGYANGTYVSSATLTAGTNNGDPPQTGDADYVTNAGKSVLNAAGNAGAVVLKFA